MFNQRKLGEILVQQGSLSEQQLLSALENNQLNGRIGEYLLSEGLIKETQLIQAIAQQFHHEYVELDDFIVDPGLFELIPANIAMQLNVVPYELKVNNTLVVIYSDPFDLTLLKKLENITKLRVEFRLSTRKQIIQTLKRSEGSSVVLKSVSEEFKPVFLNETEDGEEREIGVDEIEDTSSPVVKLINSIIVAAIQKRVSDIHLETFEEGINVKYRIDGVLYSATEALDKQHHASLITRLKVMSNLDIAEKRIPQDGRFKVRLAARDIDFRVSILPCIYGEDVVIRILDKSSIGDEMQKLSLENLGMDDDMMLRFRKAVREPYGMVLITGPTGSGKTTTLYAALTELNSGEEKIITIEDPVEYQLPGVIQVPVNEKKNLTFAKGLRSILRHDPDKIMVGEIRDKDTAEIAVQSALTGHLVFTTVHANNVFDVISRFSHMGIDIYNFVSALNCVIAQRLVRRICEKCKVEEKIGDDELLLSGLNPEDYANSVWYKGSGCSACNNTGFYGRAAITEFLDLSPNMKDMIIARKTSSELMKAAIEEGFISLRKSALNKVLTGVTTLKEINRVTFVE
jgi:type IV pilus assembly protein PilB